MKLIEKIKVKDVIEAVKELSKLASKHGLTRNKYNSFLYKNPFMRAEYEVHNKTISVYSNNEIEPPMITSETGVMI